MPILSKNTLDKMTGGLMSARAQQALNSRDAALYGGSVYQPSNTGRAMDDKLGPRICGAHDCGSSWVKPWKNRRRPIFEEEWGCSSRCLSTMIRAAVRREVGEGPGYDTPHRHRVPLGLVLLAQGWITHPQLQAALEAQKQSGEGRIGDWLVQSCGLDEERVTRGLGVQWSCPVLAPEGFSPNTMALVMPKRFISEFGIVPLRVAGSSLLYLAFENRLDPAVSLGVEQMLGIKVESGLLSGTQFGATRDKVLAAEGVSATFSAVEDADALSLSMLRVVEQRQPVASRIVRVHNYYWLRIWLETGAISGIGRLPSGTAEVEDHVYAIGR